VGGKRHTKRARDLKRLRDQAAEKTRIKKKGKKAKKAKG